MKVHRRSRRHSGSNFGWIKHLKLPLQMVMAAVVVFFAMVTGLARAEFQQPYYHNGFGFDSQLPLMPNNPLDDQLLVATAAAGNPAQSGASLDSRLISAANAAWGMAAGDVAIMPANVNHSYARYLSRKEVLLPLIADLIRFHNLNNEVYEAYVLNVDQHSGHHGQMDRNGTRNDTAGGGVTLVTSVVIDSSSTGSSAVPLNTGNSAATHEHLEQLLLNDLSFLDLGGSAHHHHNVEDGDLPQEDILEQNLADLNDFCDTNSNNMNSEQQQSGGGAGSNPYFNFNNLSYNLIPKDLLEATDLFWTSPSASPLVIGESRQENAEVQKKTREDDDGDDDDPEDKKYLQYINKDDGKEEDVEGAESLAAFAATLKQELVETEDERLQLAIESYEPIKTDGDEMEGSTVVKEEVLEDEEDLFCSGDIVMKLEEYEENDLIEEVVDIDDEEAAAYLEVNEEEVEMIKEDKNEEQKPVIFNVLDLVDDEDQHHTRDWFLNGNEVLNATRRSRSSTFDDIRIDELSDEVIDLVCE